MTLEHHVTSLTTAFKLSPRCSVGCRMLQEWCMLPGWRLIGMRWGLVWCFGVLNLSPHMELEGRLRSSGGRREEMGAGEWDGKWMGNRRMRWGKGWTPFLLPSQDLNPNLVKKIMQVALRASVPYCELCPAKTSRNWGGNSKAAVVAVEISASHSSLEMTVFCKLKAWIGTVLVKRKWKRKTNKQRNQFVVWKMSKLFRILWFEEGLFFFPSRKTKTLNCGCHILVLLRFHSEKCVNKHFFVARDSLPDVFILNVLIGSCVLLSHNELKRERAMYSVWRILLLEPLLSNTAGCCTMGSRHLWAAQISKYFCLRPWWSLKCVPYKCSQNQFGHFIHGIQKDLKWGPWGSERLQCFAFKFSAPRHINKGLCI